MSKSVNTSGYAKIVFKGVDGMKKVNQLTTFEKFKTKNMLFSDVSMNKVPNSTISYKRVNIATKNSDNTYGDLLILTPRVFSFGVSENKSFNDPTQRSGYTLPLCLWSRDGPTEEEKNWISSFDDLCKYVKSCVDAKPQDFGVPRGQSLQEKYNPLFQKKDEASGEVIDKSKGPTLYAKLLESKKTNSISTVFRDVYGADIEPLSLLKRYCYVQCVLKIESLYIGSGKIILQIKVTEVANVELVESGPRTAFIKPIKTKMVMASNGKNLNDTDTVDENGNESETKNSSEEGNGSVENSDDDDQPALVLNTKIETKPEPEKEKPKAKPQARRVVQKQT